MRRLARRHLMRILALLVTIGITVGLYVFRGQLWDIHTYEKYVYAGAFLVGLVSCATVILPVPGVVVVAALGGLFNPQEVGTAAAVWGCLGVGVAAGAGSALGELTGYLAGYGGQPIIEKRKLYSRMEAWMRRQGGLVILVLALVPNPVFDLAGMAAGALRFPVWRFLAMCFLGKTGRSVGLAIAAAWGIPFVLELVQR